MNKVNIVAQTEGASSFMTVLIRSGTSCQLTHSLHPRREEKNIYINLEQKKKRYKIINDSNANGSFCRRSSSSSSSSSSVREKRNSDDKYLFSKCFFFFFSSLFSRPNVFFLVFTFFFFFQIIISTIIY